MKIEYDKIADAKYVRIKKGKVSSTKEEKNWLIFDLAKNGEVLGVEVLDCSKHPVSIFTVKGKYAGYFEPEFSSEKNKYESMKLEVPKSELFVNIKPSILGKELAVA